MSFKDVLGRLQDAMTVDTVFGEPVERDGVVVIPAATIGMGGGGGGGQDSSGDGGEGAGFGAGGRALGAFVVRDGDVTWRPAVDVNRVVYGAAVVVAILLLTRWRIEVARAKARMKG